MARKKPPTPHRSGYVAIVGRPNVGKSTLMNALCGERVAAVSAKPQTTRNRILGVKTLPHAQILFFDTPGIHEPHSELNRYMVRTAERALEEVDILYFLVDLNPQRVALDDLDAVIAERIRPQAAKKFLVINKVDQFRRKEALLPRIALYKDLCEFAEVFPISALEGTGLDALLDATVAALPEGPAYYPADIYTDQAERFLAAEIVREQIFRKTREELPYASAVTVESWTEIEGRIDIHATIHVERESQKSIVIGKGGAMLKNIGTAARRELAEMLATRVNLFLFVRVEPNWRKSPEALRKLGYEPP
jgi:GTP-binding protein Era